MRICLYTTITAARENLPRLRAPWRAFKDAVKRARDQARWTLSNDRAFDFNAWSTATDTNRGDMAIRHAVRMQLAEQFGPTTDFLEVPWGELTAATIAEINATCDLFVISGGGYLFIEEDGSLGNKRLAADIPFLKMIRCPRVAYAIGLNQVLPHGAAAPPAFNSAAAAVLREWLSALELVSARDEPTAALLRQIDQTRCPVIGDPALFLKTARSGGTRNGRVGINFAVHGQLSQALFSRNFFVYRDMLRHLERQGLTLDYVIHSDIDPVAVRMFRREGIRLGVIDVPAPALVDAYAGLDFVVCQMLHSAILASAAGVPSVNIAYDRKNFAFYDLLGMPAQCIGHAEYSGEWLDGRLSALRSERPSMVEHLTARKQALHDGQREVLRQIAEILSCHQTPRLTQSSGT